MSQQAGRTGAGGKDWFLKETPRQTEGTPGFIPYRFFLMPGQSATLVFLDDVDFFTMEHVFPGPDGKWRTFMPCIKDFDKCPACALRGVVAAGGKPPAGYFSSKIAVATVINATGYTKQDGTEVKNMKQLLVMRADVFKKLERKSQEKLPNGLKYAAVRFTRDSKNEAGTGEDIEIIRTFTPEQIASVRAENVEAAAFLNPYDYMSLFALKPAEEMVATLQSWGAPYNGISMGVAAPRPAASAPRTRSALEMMDDMPGQASTPPWGAGANPQQGGAVSGLEAGPAEGTADEVFEAGVDNLLKAS